MNWVFYALIIIAACLIWFGLASLFRPTGKAAKKIWKKTMDTINEEDEVEEESKDENIRI